MQQVLLCYVTEKDRDWIIQIHHSHGNHTYHQKHVHVRKRGLKGEYSWNIDGSRHDKHRFPSNERCINAAKIYAAETLGIPPSSLSFMVGIPGGARISVRSVDAAGKNGLPVFYGYVPVRLSFVLFGENNGLVMVLNENS